MSARLLVLALLTGAPLVAVAQVGAGPSAPRPVPPQRPIPYPITPSREYRAAIDGGTRTPTGRPGPRYWQNWSDYRIRARIIPDTKRVEGSADIRYQNRSPDTLDVLVLDLVQNLHAPGVTRREEVEVTGGMQLTRVQVRGQTLLEDGTFGPRYAVDGTKLLLDPGQPVRPGEAVDITIHWAFTVPQAGAGARMGHSGGNLFYLAYFYPQMAQYDDIVGWHPDPFLGPAEFYSGFGSYEVTIEAPAGWLVMGTGDLTNAPEVLAGPVYERMRAAERSDSVVHVVTAADFARVTRFPGGAVAWTFRADSVRDVAYSITRESLWDAARTAVGDRNGDGRTDYARVDAIYRRPASRWARVARYSQHAVRFLSEFTGYPYPWPHMTAVEGGGIIGGGMEYPMMTLIGEYTAAGDDALYAVTAHEIAHMWIPMIVSTDERRYGWMDEGTTTFNENQAKRSFFPGTNPELADREEYLQVAEAELEGEIMRWSDYQYPGPAFTIASYYKPGAVLSALRGLLGEETFQRAYREFFDRWAFKHPYPWDLWNTFEDVSGRDLDWFWRSWYYETWLLDHAVGSVTRAAGGTQIVIEDRGDVPMPARLSIRLAGGETLQREVPVESWLGGARTATVTVAGEVVRVEIDAANQFPDRDRSNNVWSR